jgi:hypothetical protein
MFTSHNFVTQSRKMVNRKINYFLQKYIHFNDIVNVQQSDIFIFYS